MKIIANILSNKSIFKYLIININRMEIYEEYGLNNIKYGVNELMRKFGQAKQLEPITFFSST